MSSENGSPKRMFRRSVHIREIDSGSCGACELEIAAMAHPAYDMERLGYHIVASPRHADVFMVTGPVSANMRDAATRTIDAAPSPKFVIAVGDCACGKNFAPSTSCAGRLSSVVDVDLEIPGCPPSPQELLDALEHYLRG